MRNSWAEQEDKFFQEQGRGNSRGEMRKPTENGEVYFVERLWVDHGEEENEKVHKNFQHILRNGSQNEERRDGGAV